MPSPIAAVRSVVVAVLLVLGLSACDSGGSSEEETPRDVTQSFSVSVVDVPNDYAYADRNNVGVVYAIDGEAAAEIALQPGETYAFELGGSVADGPNGQAHPFYVGTTAEGQGGDEYGTGVENAGATTGTVFFTPPSSSPDSLFYQCGAHVYMGGRMAIAAGGSSSYGR